MFALFKNACVYSLRRPEVFDVEKLNEMLSAFPFQECGANDMSRTGWRPIVKDSDSYCHVAGKNILLVVQNQKKIIPPTFVKEKLDARVEKLEQEQARRLKQPEKTTIKEEVLHGLLPRAFTRNSTIQLWIDLERGRIVVDTVSPRIAENALSLLRKSLGSLPVVPIMSANPPAHDLTDWLKAHSAPKPFYLGDITTAKVESMLEVGAMTTFKKEPVGSEALEVSLSDNRFASSVSVRHKGHFETDLTLSDDLIFKRFIYSDLFIDANGGTCANDDEDESQALARKDADFTLMCDTLGTIISDALTAFGGEAER